MLWVIIFVIVKSIQKSTGKLGLQKSEVLEQKFDGGNRMERILTMDEKNYPLDLEEIYRVAVRGIIFIDGKLLM